MAKAIQHTNCAGALRFSTVLILSLTGSACGGGTPGDNTTNNIPATGAAEPAQSGLPSNGLLMMLDDQSVQGMKLIDRYAVTNKLLSTLYQGVSVDDYFDINQGFTPAVKIDEQHDLSAIYQKLNTPLSEKIFEKLNLEILGSENVGFESRFAIEPRYSFTRQQSREIPLARIATYGLSLDGFSQWMAWTLANSILFSPSADLDSVDMNDVQNVFRRLDHAIMTNTPIREVVYEHMRSLENWRRFRSPEDNTREMMEIFLGLENLDDQVPGASKACQDLYLTSENEGYMLARTDFPNGDVQQVLDTQIVSCDDFYRTVANHDRLLPTIAGVLVRYFFAGRDRSFQSSVVDQLIQRNPVTFTELISPIIFSREYLLNTERLKSFEEAYLGTAARIKWQPPEGVFRGMASGQGGSGKTYMSEMGWPAMSAKLGRNAGIASDSLSFANFHKALREELLIQSYRWRESLGLVEPSSPTPEPVPPLPERATHQEISEHNDAVRQFEAAVEALSGQNRFLFDREYEIYQDHSERHERVKLLSIEEFVDYLFLSVVARTASPLEKRKLIGIFDHNGFLREEDEGTYINYWSRDNAGKLVLDYLSRLPETYYLLKAGA